MATTHQQRCRPRSESRRSEILDVALQVFLENGYSGATIDLVVARANASKATIYSYFGGKEGLFTAIIEERTEQIISCLSAQDFSDADVPVALAQIARRLLMASLTPEAIGIYRLILSEGFRFPNVARTFYRLGPDRVTGHLARILGDWRDRGLIAVEDPELAATQFLTVALGELRLQAVAGLPPDDLDAAVEHNVRNAVEPFWRYVRPGGLQVPLQSLSMGEDRSSANNPRRQRRTG